MADIDALNASLDPIMLDKFASYYPGDVKCGIFTSNRIRSIRRMVRSWNAPNKKQTIKLNYCTVDEKGTRNGGAGRKLQVGKV